MLLKEIVELPSRLYVKTHITENELIVYDAEEIENIEVPDREIDQDKLKKTLNDAWHEWYGDEKFPYLDEMVTAIINSNIFKTNKESEK